MHTMLFMLVPRPPNIPSALVPGPAGALAAICSDARMLPVLPR
jgi:hypothetical protein